MNPKILCLLVLLMASGYLPSVAATYEELNRSFSDGDLQRVIKLAEADVKKDPTSIDALYFLGVAYERLDQHDKAIRVLTQSRRFTMWWSGSRRMNRRLDPLLISCWWTRVIPRRISSSVNTT